MWKLQKQEKEGTAIPNHGISNAQREWVSRDSAYSKKGHAWSTLVLSTRCSPDPSLSCFWVAIVSVLISSCSATLGTLVSELSLGAGLGSWLTWEWSVACDGWGVASAQASAEGLRVIWSQVRTRARASECDEPEMRTTSRCNIQSAVTEHHVTG